MVHMCPDSQIISLYYDEELPSPWKEKMEAHLEACASCRAVLAGYGRLGKGLAALNHPEEFVATAQDRVWEKLSVPETEFYRGSGQKT